MMKVKISLAIKTNMEVRLKPIIKWDIVFGPLYIYIYTYNSKKNDDDKLMIIQSNPETNPSVVKRKLC